MEENPGSVKLSSYFGYFLGPKGRVAVSGIMVLVSLILSVRAHYLLQITFYFILLLAAMINWEFVKYKVSHTVYFLIHCMIVLLVILIFWGQMETNKRLGSPDSVAALCAYFLVINDYDDFVICGMNGSEDIYMVDKNTSEEEVREFFMEKERLPLEIRSRRNESYKQLWYGEQYISYFKVVQKEKSAVVLYGKG